MVILIKSIDNLAQRGIAQGCGGIIVQVNKENYRVMFMNGNNYGNGILLRLAKATLNIFRYSLCNFSHNWKIILRALI